MINGKPGAKIFYDFLLKWRVFSYEPHHRNQNICVLATSLLTIAILMDICDFTVFIKVVDLCATA